MDAVDQNCSDLCSKSWQTLCDKYSWSTGAFFVNTYYSMPLQVILGYTISKTVTCTMTWKHYVIMIGSPTAGGKYMKIQQWF